jgi:hypothetical protein
VRRHVQPPGLEALSCWTSEHELPHVGDVLGPLPFPHRPERLDRRGVHVDCPTFVILRRVEPEFPCIPRQSLRADGSADPDRLALRSMSPHASARSSPNLAPESSAVRTSAAMSASWRSV